MEKTKIPKKNRLKKTVYYTLVLANIGAVTALLLSYLSCFVSPEKMWLLAFFGVAYKYLLVINICFVVLWIVFRKKILFLSLLTILAGLSFIGRNYQWPGSSKVDQEKDGIKILSYNVNLFYKTDAVQKDGTKLNVFDFIRDGGFNIICLQEVRAEKTGALTISNIQRMLSAPYSYLEQTVGSIGLAIYTSYPIIRKELIFSERTTNASIYADLLIGVDTVRVYNVHLKSIGFTKEHRALLNNALDRDYVNSDVNTIKAILRRMTEASTLRSRQVDIMKKHISKSPYPVIICGDFNDPPVSYTYQHISRGQKDSFMEAGSGKGVTYNVGAISSLRIDYIFHSPVFRAYHYESPRLELSDHYPVISFLENNAIAE